MEAPEEPHPQSENETVDAELVVVEVDVEGACGAACSFLSVKATVRFPGVKRALLPEETSNPKAGTRSFDFELCSQY